MYACDGGHDPRQASHEALRGIRAQLRRHPMITAVEGIPHDTLHTELHKTARESRPYREAGVFRPQSEPDAEQGVDKSLRDLFAHQKSPISGDGRESRALH